MYVQNYFHQDYINVIMPFGMYIIQMYRKYVHNIAHVEQ